MNLLSSIFGAGVRARNKLYDRGIARAQKAQGPVVSVGNLSVGGSGKTPFVLLLGELLKARGVKFDILSRGYGRKQRGLAQVDPGGSARGEIANRRIRALSQGPMRGHSASAIPC